MAIFTDRSLLWDAEGAEASEFAVLTDELPRFVAQPAIATVTATNPMQDNVTLVLSRIHFNPREALNFAAAALIMLCSFFARGSVNSGTAGNGIWPKAVRMTFSGYCDAASLTNWLAGDSTRRKAIPATMQKIWPTGVGLAVDTHTW